MSFAISSNEGSFKSDEQGEHDPPIALYEVARAYNEENQEQISNISCDHAPEETTFRASSIRGHRYDNNIPIDDRPSEINIFRDLPSFQLNQNEISVQVLNPTLKGGKFVVYTIKGGDKEGAFETYRTQDQFIEIRNLLVNRWPGCYIPALPPKRLLMNTKSDFLEQRRKQFEMFCQNMSELHFLYYSPEYQTFLKSNSGDLSLELVKFHRIDYDEIMSRMQTHFSYAYEKEATNTDFKKIEDFKIFLQSINGNFVRYKAVLKKVVKARHAYFEQFALLQETMCTDFEKKILTGYQSTASISTVGSETLISDMKEKADKIRTSGDSEPMEYLHAWIKLEGREIEAFLEAIGQREKYIALKGKLLEKQRSANKTLDKVIDGKSTIKTFFSLKGKDEEIEALEKEIANCKKEVEVLNVLIEKIALVLSHYEIDKFKKNKADQYHHVVTMAAQNELGKLRDMSDFWITVLKKKDARTITNLDVTSN